MSPSLLLSEGSRQFPAEPAAARYIAPAPQLTATYVLPDGQRVEIPTDLARGAGYVGFTLTDGRVVHAQRLDLVPVEMLTAEVALENARLTAIVERDRMGMPINPLQGAPGAARAHNPALDGSTPSPASIPPFIELHLPVRSLKSGDVCVGSGFTLTRSPYVNGPRKTEVVGFYPGKPVQIVEWNPGTTIRVRRAAAEGNFVDPTNEVTPAEIAERDMGIAHDEARRFGRRVASRRF